MVTLHLLQDSQWIMMLTVLQFLLSWKKLHYLKRLRDVLCSPHSLFTVEMTIILVKAFSPLPTGLDIITALVTH